jgi:hypothetical protein
MRAIRFCSFGGYPRFGRAWWRDLLRWLTRGWMQDIATFWHRARYGWAPRDVWGLDHYLACVMGGTLRHLSDTTQGAPIGYPTKPDYRGLVAYDPDAEPNFDLWKADLRRWSDVCTDFVTDNYYELYGNDVQWWNADEAARSLALHRALREMEPHFESLWD